MIALQGTRHIERCRAHTQRIENLLLHGLVISRPEFRLGIIQVCADVAGRRRHQIAVLEHLAEFAGRLHGPEERER